MDFSHAVSVVCRWALYYTAPIILAVALGFAIWLIRKGLAAASAAVADAVARQALPQWAKAFILSVEQQFSDYTGPEKMELVCNFVREALPALRLDAASLQGMVQAVYDLLSADTTVPIIGDTPAPITEAGIANAVVGTLAAASSKKPKAAK